MPKIGDLMQKFIMSSPKRAIWFMTTMPASFWEKKSQKMALQTFHEAAKKVPAYQDFLKKHNVNPDEIKTLKDFQEKVPIMAKNNYLSQYSLEQLSQGEIKKESFGMCFTSGTTGKPASMLISKKSLPQVIYGVMGFFHHLWEIRSSCNYTLCINGFALGPWLASFLSNFVLGKEAEQYNFTLITVGSDPKRMTEILEEIGDNYDQVLIMGYSSILKQFFEEAERNRINLKKYNIRILSSGEPLPKNFKKYILDQIGDSEKDFWKILDFFATTDASVLGFGTPLATVLHQIINTNKRICSEIFNLNEIENLFQYNPASIFLEEKENKILVTKPGIIPLIRYQIGDLGKVISFEKMKEVLEKEGYNIDDLLKKADWQKGYFKWPFFTYLGRADNMLKIYSGAKVYAENLLGILEKPEAKEIRSFKLTTENDENLNTRLIVYLELKPGLAPSTQELDRLTKKYQKIIHEELFKNNLEYQDAYRLNSEVVLPIVRIFTYGKGIFERDKSKPKTKLLI